VPNSKNITKGKTKPRFTLGDMAKNKKAREIKAKATVGKRKARQ
jgi:hypothetical protein